MNLGPECERGRTGVEFLVETVLSLCKLVGLLRSGKQFRGSPFQLLIYVLEDTGRYKVAICAEMASNMLRNSGFAMQCAVPFSFPLAVQICIIDGLPPSSLTLLLQSSCALLSQSRCRDQRVAWGLISRLSGLVSFHAYFLALIQTTSYWHRNWKGLAESLFLFFFFIIQLFNHY